MWCAATIKGISQMGFVKPAASALKMVNLP
jgi:hypothetical protein